MDKNGLIDSQEEYDKELANYESRIKEIKKMVYRNPGNMLKEFYILLDRSERIGLFSKEFCDKQRNDITNLSKNEKLRDKFKYLLKRKGIIKDKDEGDKK